MNIVLILTLMLFLAISAIYLVLVRDLFIVIMLSGIFTFIAATIYILMDAVDVAFTEAVVGVGMSTVLLLGTLALTLLKEKEEKTYGMYRISLWALLPAIICAVLLIYGSFYLPAFADINAAAHTYVAPRYIFESLDEVGVPNVVTSVLASYRGFDTLGEVMVVFTAAIGVLALLGRSPRKAKPREEEAS